MWDMRRIAFAALFITCAFAQDLKEFEKRVTEFTLKNGLHFIIVERHEAPVVSFHTYINAGAVDDPNGKTGVAHMFEHMAFKGTEAIGSKNIVAEKRALANIEKVYDELDQEKRKGPTADKTRVGELEKKLKDAIETANSYVDSELYTRILEESGENGLNASTAPDATRYFYSLPSNRLELWYLMESDRFLHPVFREFYKERDVVREEKRMRVESSPNGRLFEILLAGAFEGHPYKNPPAAFSSDIENLRVGDAERFMKTYYVPGNMTIAIVGDIDPKECRRLAEQYFGPMVPAPLPPGVITVEPQQEGERRVTMQSPAQPLFIVGYKRPDQNHTDDAVFDVIDGIVSGGRTGWMYQEMVEKSQTALAVDTGSGLPGGKYPNLYAFMALPNSGKTIDDFEKGVYEIIDRLKKETIDETTMKRVKTKVRASVIRQLGSNPGLAAELTRYHVSYGDWRMLFRSVEEIDKVSAADVQRVAKQYFIDKTRTVAYHVKPTKEGR